MQCPSWTLQVRCETLRTLQNIPAWYKIWHREGYMRCKHYLKDLISPVPDVQLHSHWYVYFMRCVYNVHVHKLLSTANLVYSKFFPTNDPRKSTLVRYQHLITVDMPQNSSIPGKTSKPEEMGNRNGVWFTTPYSKIDCKKILFLLECFWSWYLRCSKLILSHIHKSQ